MFWVTRASPDASFYPPVFYSPLSHPFVVVVVCSFPVNLSSPRDLFLLLWSLVSVFPLTWMTLHQASCPLLGKRERQ